MIATVAKVAKEKAAARRSFRLKVHADTDITMAPPRRSRFAGSISAPSFAAKGGFWIQIRTNSITGNEISEFEGCRASKLIGQFFS